ncbi:MAG TPA: hypothetical protein VNW15_12000, partial [Rhizomicrobium sp.]|nr:hypothetical protein [Rhizomicrobium sp.]
MPAALKSRALLALFAIAVLTGAAYVFLLPGLSVARQEPSGLEVQIATYLLHHSVPRSAINAVNP